MKNLFVKIIKAFVLTFTFCFANVFTSNAQVYNSLNSTTRCALTMYVMDNNGFYRQQSNRYVDFVDGIVERYAFDKSARLLYVMTENANYSITVTEDEAKRIKKENLVPIMKQTYIQSLIPMYNSRLYAKFEEMNKARQREIEDSIQQVKKREKQIADSLEAVRIAEEHARQEQERIEREAALRQQAVVKLAEYRKSHDWHIVPIDSRVSCVLCDYEKGSSYHSSKDSIYVIGIANDSVYYMTSKMKDLGQSYSVLHISPLSQIMNNSEFQYHFEAFKDSLNKRSSNLSYKSVLSYNKKQYDEYLAKIKKIAPFGYVGEWSWDNDFSVSFHVDYCNTSKTTIKYIDFYWKVLNGVDDVRGTGSFSGTGPVDEWETATWNWDYSHYYVAGDADYMKITKIVITYMNGTKKVLTGDNIIFSEDFE